MKAITSRDNPLLARVRKLVADPAAYRKLGQLWVEGEHLCSAYAQRGGTPLIAVIDEAAWRQPALRALAQGAAEVAVVPEALMRGLSPLDSPPRIGFVLEAPGAVALRAGVASLVLDRLQDPRQRRQPAAQRRGVRLRAGDRNEGHGCPVVAKGAARRDGSALRAASGRGGRGCGSRSLAAPAARHQFACKRRAAPSRSALALCVAARPRRAGR